MGDTGALSEEGHTPRQEFIRKMLKMGRMPVPILLRDPAALQDLNLASKGLGDDVMCAAAEASKQTKLFRRYGYSKILRFYIMRAIVRATREKKRSSCDCLSSIL